MFMHKIIALSLRILPIVFNCGLPQKISVMVFSNSVTNKGLAHYGRTSIQFLEQHIHKKQLPSEINIVLGKRTWPGLNIHTWFKSPTCTQRRYVIQYYLTVACMLWN